MIVQQEFLPPPPLRPPPISPASRPLWRAGAVAAIAVGAVLFEVAAQSAISGLVAGLAVLCWAEAVYASCRQPRPGVLLAMGGAALAAGSLV